MTTALHFSRRRATIALLAFAGIARAQVASPVNPAPPSSGGAPSIFEAIENPSPQDRQRVLFFFDPHCPFSAQTHAGFVSWGRTLPKPWRFEPIPYLATPAATPWAIAYYAAHIASPSRLDPYVAALYQQAALPSATAPAAAAAAARASGIPASEMRRAMRASQMPDLLTAARMRSLRANITYTPTLVVDGRYRIHAELTAGDYGLLSQLANGLVSMIIRGETP